MAIFVLRPVSKYIHFVSSFIRPAEKGHLFGHSRVFHNACYLFVSTEKNYRLKAIKPVFKQDCFQTELQLRLLKFQLPSIIRLKKTTVNEEIRRIFIYYPYRTISNSLQKFQAGLHF